MSLATEETLRVLATALTGVTFGPGGGLASEETLQTMVAAGAPYVVVRPRGSGADDAPTITSFLAGGNPVVLADNSTFTIATSIVFPPTGGVLHLSAGTILNANVIGTAVIFADTITGRTNPPGGAVTTSGTATVGSYSLSVSALHGLVAGNAVVIVGPNSVQLETHIIRTATGTTLTFREPIERPFASGSGVMLLAGLPSVRITGDAGSQITGSCSFGVALSGAIDSYVGGFTIALSCSGGAGGENWPIDFNWSCRSCVAENLHIVADATNPGEFAIQAEMNINTVFRNITIDQSAAQFTAAAIESQSCINHMIVGCQMPHSAIAVLIGVSGDGTHFDTYGARNVTVVGCRGSDSTYGGWVENGGRDVQFIGCSFPRCTIDALVVSAPSTGSFPNSVVVTGGDYSAAGSNGVLLAGGVGHFFRGMDLTGCVNGVSINGADAVVFEACILDSCTTSAATIFAGSGAVRFARCFMRSCTANVMTIASTSDVYLDECDLATSTAPTPSATELYISGAARVTVRGTTLGWRADPPGGSNIYYAIQAVAACDLTLDDVLVLEPANTASNPIAVIVNAAAKVRLRKVRTDTGGVTGAGGGTSYGYYGGVAHTLYDLGAVDFSSTNTPLTLAANTNTNFGTVVANGSSDVTLSHVVSPGAEAVMSFLMTTLGGIPAAIFPSSAITAGSVTVRSLAANTSTYTWVLR